MAGFSAWRKLGRFVRRGEKGIAILVPMTLRRSLMELVMASERTTSRARAQLSVSSLATCSMSTRRTPAFAEVTGEPGDHVVALKGFLASRNIEPSYGNAELALRTVIDPTA